jgi:hypothetical protein
MQRGLGALPMGGDAEADLGGHGLQRGLGRSCCRPDPSHDPRIEP